MPEARRTEIAEASDLRTLARSGSLMLNPNAGAPPPAEVLALAARHLLDRGRVELAHDVAAAALAEDPACANAHSVMHVVCDELGKWVKGLSHARRAAELQPKSAQLRYNFALSALRLDDYGIGFEWMEARIDKPDWTGLAIAPSRAAERHRLLRPGVPVNGKRILVVCEQGLGDCIMFARYLSMLVARGAHVALVCSPLLRSLFERIDGIETILSPPSDQPFAKINLSRAEFDLWAPLLSLPYYFGTEFGTVPDEIPYLTVDPDRVAAWRARYEAAGRSGVAKIGLVFHANPASASAGQRSIPLADLAPMSRARTLTGSTCRAAPPAANSPPPIPKSSTRQRKKSRSTSSPPRLPRPTSWSASIRWRRIALARSGIRCCCWCRIRRTGPGASVESAPPGIRPHGFSASPPAASGLRRFERLPRCSRHPPSKA